MKWWLIMVLDQNHEKKHDGHEHAHHGTVKWNILFTYGHQCSSSYAIILSCVIIIKSTCQRDVSWLSSSSILYSHIALLSPIVNHWLIIIFKTLHSQLSFTSWYPKITYLPHDWWALLRPDFSLHCALVIGWQGYVKSNQQTWTITFDWRLQGD